MIEHRTVTLQYIRDDNLYDAKCAIIGKFPKDDWDRIRPRASVWLGRLCEVSVENGVILGIRRVEEIKINYSLAHRSGDD